MYGGSGDSSIPTAQGVIYGLQATNRALTGSDDLAGKSYSIQGLGKVGLKVAERLIEEGADLYVTECFVERTKLVHEYRKFLFVDPGLPEELLPEKWLGSQFIIIFCIGKHGLYN